MKSIGPADYARLERFFADQRYPLSPYTLASILVWSNKLYRPYAADAAGDLVVGGQFAGPMNVRVGGLVGGQELVPGFLNGTADTRFVERRAAEAEKEAAEAKAEAEGRAAEAKAAETKTAETVAGKAAEGKPES